MNKTHKAIVKANKKRHLKTIKKILNPFDILAKQAVRVSSKYVI
jgi:hypothetical protein